MFQVIEVWNLVTLPKSGQSSTITADAPSFLLFVAPPPSKPLLLVNDGSSPLNPLILPTTKLAEVAADVPAEVELLDEGLQLDPVLDDVQHAAGRNEPQRHAASQWHTNGTRPFAVARRQREIAVFAVFGRRKAKTHYCPPFQLSSG